jgi:hypothetical protein
MSTYDLFPYGFEYTPPFDAMWVLQFQLHAWTARPTRGLGRPGPPAGVASDGAVIEWCAAFLDKEVSVADEWLAMWEQYQLTARALRQHE